LVLRRSRCSHTCSCSSPPSATTKVPPTKRHESPRIRIPQFRCSRGLKRAVTKSGPVYRAATAVSNLSHLSDFLMFPSFLLVAQTAINMPKRFG
jgi:hypothetical protein